MSNYPPGVTGNEMAISGPHREWDVADWECPRCDHVGDADGWFHPMEGTWIDCPECGFSQEQDDPGWDDPDREYEARGDR